MNADIYGVNKCYKMPPYEEILQYVPQIFYWQPISLLCNSPVMAIFQESKCTNVNLSYLI